MNKKKFTIFYSIWWMLTYVISYLKIGFAFGIAGVMINQRGSINSDSLDTVSIIFSLATGACYVGMYVITNKWGTVVGKKWLVSMPVIGGLFDALIGIPIIPTILCIIGLILGLTSDPLDSSQKKEHPGQSKSTKEINFAGVTELSNDAYKIYLVERYTITKNDVLAGFTLNGSIYNSLDEALIAAHALHCPKISIPSTQDIKEVIESESQKITSSYQFQTADTKSSIQNYAQSRLEQTQKNDINYKKYQPKKSSNTKIIFASIALILFSLSVYRYFQLSQDNELSFSNRSPEDRCRTAKKQALKSSEPFFLAIMKGERGMSVPGYQEAISATKSAGLVCGIDNYTYIDLLNDSEYTASGFALKDEKEKKTIRSEIAKSDTLVKTLESLELKSKVNELNGDWRVLWRLSEQTGDLYGYFYKSNSDIDKRIRESCHVESICTFKFEYEDLGYDQIKDALPKDFSGASFYGEIKKIIDVSN